MSRHVLVIFALLASAMSCCAQELSSAPGGSDLVRSGKLRTALFKPQYTKDAVTGRIRGLGLGVIALDVAGSLAARLGVEMQVVEEPGPEQAIACVTSGACDVMFMGIETERMNEVDFTPAIVQFDYTYLLPSNSSIQSVTEVDRPGVRIATVGGHAAALALAKTVKHAEIVSAELPDAAFELLRTGKVDAFALPREVLLYYASKLDGSRVLQGGYGFNRTGIAIAKNRPAQLAFLSAFVEQAKASGMIRQIIDGNKMRGFDDASPVDHVSR